MAMKPRESDPIKEKIEKAMETIEEKLKLSERKYNYLPYMYYTVLILVIIHG